MLLQPLNIALINQLDLRRKIATISKPPSSFLWGNCHETSINEILFREEAVNKAMIISTEVGFHYDNEYKY